MALLLTKVHRRGYSLTRVALAAASNKHWQHEPVTTSTVSAADAGASQLALQYRSCHTACSNITSLLSLTQRLLLQPSARTVCMLHTSSSSRGGEGSVPDSVWQLGRLNHIAIAVPDLQKSVSFYRDVLRATVSEPQPLPSHGVTTVFVELDNTKLELLHPLGDNSPIQKFLLKNKAGGLHHVCLEVDNIAAAMAAVTSSGVRCLSKEPKIGAHNKPVVFLHPADCNGVLVELEQA